MNYNAYYYYEGKVYNFTRRYTKVTLLLFQIQRKTEGKDWFWYVDKTVTLELLETLTTEFLAILDKCPNRLKKIMNSSQFTEDRSKSSQPSSSSSSSSSSMVPSSRSTLAAAAAAAAAAGGGGGGGQSSAVASHTHDHNSHGKTSKCKETLK